MFPRRYEETLTCPYNPAHQILPTRFSLHVTKCAKNHPSKEMRICPFNASHHVEPYLFESHILECKDRAIVEREIFCEELGQCTSQLRVVDVNTDVSGSSNSSSSSAADEDWDSECATKAYNPMDVLLTREIIRPPPYGLTKSERKLYRKTEATRVQRLQEGRSINDLVFPTPNGLVSVGEMLAASVEKMGFPPESDEDGVIKESCRRRDLVQPLEVRYPKAFSAPRIAANIFCPDSSDSSSVSSAGQDERCQEEEDYPNVRRQGSPSCKENSKSADNHSCVEKGSLTSGSRRISDHVAEGDSVSFSEGEAATSAPKYGARPKISRAKRLPQKCESDSTTD